MKILSGTKENKVIAQEKMNPKQGSESFDSFEQLILDGASL